MAPNDKTPGSMLDNAIDNAKTEMNNVRKATEEKKDMAPNLDKTPGSMLDDAIDNAKTEMSNVREKVHEATEEQKEVVKHGS